MEHSVKSVELFILRLFPAAFTIVMLILCMIYKHIWGINIVMPLLPTIPVFYWGRVRSPDMPYWFVCLLGLLIDAPSGLLLGSTSLFYLLLLVSAHRQSKNMQKSGFIMEWIYFTIILSILCFGQWLIVSLLSRHLHNLIEVLLQLALTVSLYPLLHKCSSFIEQKRQERRWFLTHV